ncbi:hypothetical protein GCM10017608_29360 [Agromyces luteolus]|nr:hypothetical protein GCM10017608_29360 [Agromyces luteolus]
MDRVHDRIAALGVGKPVASDLTNDPGLQSSAHEPRRDGRIAELDPMGDLPLAEG